MDRAPVAALPLVGESADDSGRALEGGAALPARGLPWRAQTPRAEIPAGGDASWWARAQEEIDRQEYEVTWQTLPFGDAEGAGYQAPNRANHFRTQFAAEGIRLVPRVSEIGADWEWGLSLARWGRLGGIREVGQADLRVAGNRVELMRDGFSEWYQNDKRGLEQGFSFSQRPAGAGPLSLDLVVTGTLRMVLAEDGQSAEFESTGGRRVLRYAQLVATDASGRRLPSRMEGWCEEGHGGVRLVVEDAEASYPLTIDPLTSGPSWTATGENGGDALGFCLTSAGDVNGDGFNDVAVSAPWSGSNHGAVYIYHGSPSGLPASPDSTLGGFATGELFGYSVAPAGDVDGDGFGDLIVGAPGYGSARGRALLFKGSETGLGSIAWQVLGGYYDDWLGYSVAPAGDVNGDGLSDFVIGVPGFASGALYGAVVLFYGSAGVIPQTPVWEAYGTSNVDADYRFGREVAFAGDVNGDGYSDVAIGWPNLHKAFVYHGSASGLPAADAPSWTATVSGLFGWALATAGDVNGDGYSDLIVGAPLFTNGLNQEGAAFVYHGSSTGLSVEANWDREGNQAESDYGVSVATAGDINGDGYSEVVVGASSYDLGGTDQGRAFVYKGSSAGLPGVYHWSETGNGDEADFGACVAPAGDVNGDGYSDLLIGSPGYSAVNYGQATLYSGSADDLESAEGWSGQSDQAAASYGTVVASAGDVNGDGYGDIVVGAPYFDNGQSDEGRVFVYHGSVSGPSATADWTAEGEQASARLGYSVSTARDVNGDGFSDLLVGAPQWDWGETDEGAAFVWYGSTLGLGPAGMPSNSDWMAESNQASAYFGHRVSWAGDLNADGYADIVVGAPYYDEGQASEGEIFVWFGSASGLGLSGYPSNADWKAQSNQAGARLGTSVAAAGDVNGDGIGDLLAGAADYADGESGEGAAFLWFGSALGLGPSGTPANADWHAEGDQVDAQMGYSVAGAGDVNGDGYSDVAVGAHGYDITETDRGRVSVYHGSATGPHASPNWTRYGLAAGDFFGYSVASAGDVNGDGYGDLLVGVVQHDSSTFTNDGAAYVYLGSASGLAASYAWSAYGGQGSALFGYSVASAGDVNGDGFGDVLVGASGFDDGQAGEGLARLFYGGGGKGEVRRLRQLETDNTPLDLLGRCTVTANAAHLSVRGHGLLGRGDVALEWQRSVQATPFGWSGILGPSTWEDSGTLYVSLSATVSRLGSGVYHWRVRVLQRATTSPFQRHSRWMTTARGGWNEGAFVVWSDSDSDGIPTWADNCPNVSNPGQEDGDGDGMGNVCDNCPANANPTQADADDDDIGDVCDTCTDVDNDGFGDPGYPANTCTLDNCPSLYNPTQADADGDGAGDVCDTCTDTDSDGFGNPGYAANTCVEDNCPTLGNPGQEDMDTDGVGDLCDPDRDGDQVDNAADCSPDDGDLWAAPSPARELMVAKAGGGTLTWSAPSSPGSTSVTYDVLVSDVAYDFGVLEANCVISDTAALAVVEGSVPLSGQVYFYLVRSQNPCGTTLGSRSDGTPRTGRNCP